MNKSKLTKVKILNIAIDSKNESLNEEEAKINFSNKLIDELKNLKGEDLAPHLNAEFNKKTGLVNISLTF